MHEIAYCKGFINNLIQQTVDKKAIFIFIFIENHLLIMKK
jgi:hypothetical protein